MRQIIIFFIVMFSSQAYAASQACYQQEYNPLTRQAFATEQEYEDFRSLWQNQSPGMVNPLSLLKAYSIYKTEKVRAEQMGTDKLAHCYIGCRISQETSYHTADYVGWLKEDRDLSDCRRNSYFDEADYRATVRGAQFGESQPDAPSCARACKQVYQ